MTNDEVLGICDDLNEMPRSVTPWEAEFLDSIQKRIEDRPRASIDLTPKQLETLLNMKRKYDV